MFNTRLPHSPLDITSILDLLENKSYRLQPVHNYKEIERRLDDTIEWIQTTVLYATLDGSESEKSRCFLKLKQLQKAMRLVKKQKFLKGQCTMRCKVCESSVTYTKQNFWSELQRHEHIEEMWANYLSGSPLFEVKSEMLESQLRYDQAVLELCYPAELMRQTFKLDGVPEFTLQVRGRTVVCLLCGALQLRPGERCVYKTLLSNARNEN